MDTSLDVDEWLESTLRMLEVEDGILPGEVPEKREEIGLEEIMSRKSENNKGKYSTEHGNYFRDGRRRVDIVLVYKSESPNDQRHKERRETFENELSKQGLQLELEDCKESPDGKTYFLKVHAPWEVLAAQAEVLELRMPLKEKDERPKAAGLYERMSPGFTRHAAPLLQSHFTAVFTVARLEQFDIIDRKTFFTPAQRILIVWKLLSKARYDKDRKYKVGIQRLLNRETYTAAFPLHEGPHEIDSDSDEEEIPFESLNERQVLREEWGRFGAFYKQQPYEHIRQYFGDEAGLYFSWLGFYTLMLVPASIAGLIAFLYGVFTLESASNISSKEICDKSLSGNLTMCPLCDQVCPYWTLGDSCSYSKIAYTFDNPATVAFAVFMSLWATTLVELWKRKQAQIRWEWDLLLPQQLEDEEQRPEYEAAANSSRISPVTNTDEPYLSPLSKSLRYLASVSGVLVIAAALVMAMLGVIIYRITIVIVFYSVEDVFVKQNAKLFTSVTAAIISLIAIQTLNFLGKIIAKYFTDFEAHRTQTDYDEAYTVKIWIFEFINDYSLLIYIAVFKGRFYTFPGDAGSKQDVFARLKTDQCDPAGCLSELFIQLAIIMVGKQLLNNFLEIVIPAIQNWLKLRKAVDQELDKDSTATLPQWELDLLLKEADRGIMYGEYLELVTQYGFVTLFVAAFPLAPLFALINNIIEIRVDAYKLVAQYRRPVPRRVADMGIWFDIVRNLTILAVVSNAFVIAYTSEFIPRIVYYYNNDYDNSGYIASTLSVFNTSDFTAEDRPAIDVEDRYFPECWYRALRNPPSSAKPYDLAPLYWTIFAVRLCFVLVFEHVIFGLTSLLAFVIPDVPEEVKEKIKREQYIAREALKKINLRRAGINPDSATVSPTSEHTTINYPFTPDTEKSSPAWETSASWKHDVVTSKS